ncbi:hypothetical protein KC316_g1929 [Hortaea werneckii]|nr:hypothetical protein KC316_g1929 [Hortaea werneckii]
MQLGSGAFGTGLQGKSSPLIQESLYTATLLTAYFNGIEALFCYLFHRRLKLYEARRVHADMLLLVIPLAAFGETISGGLYWREAGQPRLLVTTSGEDFW